MKTVNTQTETNRRSSFDYDPQRHYVLVQKPDSNWDGPQLDRLMDETTEDGEEAYRLELDGSIDAKARRVTGHRQMTMLSCPKSHIEAKVAASSAASREQSYRVVPNSETEDRIQFMNALSIEDIVSR